MSANYDRNILLVYGNVQEALLYRKMKRATYYHYLAGCYIHEADQGVSKPISVLNLSSAFDAAMFLATIHNKVTNDDIYREPTAKKFKKTPETMVLNTLKTFPDMGEKRGKQLLKLKKNIKSVVNMSKEELSELKGFGPKRSEKIYNHVNQKVKIK